MAVAMYRNYHLLLGKTRIMSFVYIPDKVCYALENVKA